MILDLAVDADQVRWHPGAEWESRARALLAGLGPADGALEVVLTGDELVHHLNREYRDKDAATDVLSFSYLSGHEPHRHSLLDGAHAAAAVCEDPCPEGEPVIVGQVLISIDSMRARTVRKDHSDEDELLFLVVHGLLHILGFDHALEADAAEMQEQEDRLWARLAGLSTSTSEGGGSS